MTGQKQVDPGRWDEALPWLAHADADLRVTDLADGDIDLSLVVAFHCQQAAEKMAKAVLIAFGAAYPKIHDIAELARRGRERATRCERGYCGIERSHRLVLNVSLSGC